MSSRTAHIRHYVHGDLHEGRSGIYYCARCDLFDSAEHFSDSEHVLTRVERYQISLESWARLAKLKNSGYYRPSAAINILAELVKADIKAEKVARSPFFRWLLLQVERDDPVGDLASDAARDKSFPREKTSVDGLRGYLISKRAVPEAIVALDEAWVEFKKKGVARLGLSLSIRFAIFRRDSYRCGICGASAGDGARLEVDHKIAVAKGGSNDEHNLWTLCFECNRGKGVREL